jgi:hypothetical protein
VIAGIAIVANHGSDKDNSISVVDISAMTPQLILCQNLANVVASIGSAANGLDVVPYKLDLVKFVVYLMHLIILQLKSKFGH